MHSSPAVDPTAAGACCHLLLLRVCNTDLLHGSGRARERGRLAGGGGDAESQALENHAALSFAEERVNAAETQHSLAHPKHREGTGGRERREWRDSAELGTRAGGLRRLCQQQAINAMGRQQAGFASRGYPVCRRA